MAVKFKPAILLLIAITSILVTANKLKNDEHVRKRKTLVLK
jgi:hypothetical protein